MKVVGKVLWFFQLCFLDLKTRILSSLGAPLWLSEGALSGAQWQAGRGARCYQLSVLLGFIPSSLF